MKKQKKAYLEGEIDVEKLPKIGDYPAEGELEHKKREIKKQVKKK